MSKENSVELMALSSVKKLVSVNVTSSFYFFIEVLPAEPSTFSSQEFIMFADAGNTKKIYQMRLDSMNVKPIAIPIDEAKVNKPVALEYDKNDNRIYWTDTHDNTICRAFRNGTGYKKLFSNVGDIEGLAIDLAGGNLYWTSTTSNTIEISKLDGSFRKTLVTSVNGPRDIIVDPIGG